MRNSRSRNRQHERRRRLRSRSRSTTCSPTRPVTERGLPRTLTGWMTTTDHKAIGVAYAVTALAFLAIGGALAGLMRAELTRARDPGRRGVDVQQHLHHPRQRDGVPVRRPVRIRARQLPRAAPDRRPRHGVPAPQCTLVLAVPVRRLHHAARLRQPRAARPASAGSPTRRCRARRARQASAATSGSSR